MDSGTLGHLASRRNVLVALLLTALIATVGTIEAESTVEEGTTFTVKLPFGHVEGDMDE